MARSVKRVEQRTGPRLWGRFLQWYFGCHSLGPLNAQLLLPVTPYEAFEFGENPPPIPKRFVPCVFERSFEEGCTPDGSYVREPYDPDTRFNLYERVTERVPQGKYWLLRELDPFFRSPPPIDVTVAITRRILADLGLRLLDGRTVEAWANVDRDSVMAAENHTATALAHTALPATFSLACLLAHLAFWQERLESPRCLPGRLMTWCQSAQTTLANALIHNQFVDHFEIADELDDLAGYVLDVISRLGARSMHATGCEPPDFVRYAVLVPDTPAVEQCVRDLGRAVWLQGDPAHPARYLRIRLSIPLRAFSEAYGGRLVNPSKKPTLRYGMQPATAVARLHEAAATVPALLKAREKWIWQGYQAEQQTRSNSHPQRRTSTSIRHDGS